MDPVKFVQIGIGGYGAVHTRSIRKLAKQGLAEFLAVADPFVEENEHIINDLKALGVRHYEQYEEMLTEEEPEVVAIATPIPFHTEMILAALERGCHVLVEKPPAVLIQDIDRMLAEAQKRELMIQSGFQNIMDQPARELKQTLLAGQYGRIQRVTVIGTWQRLDSYYERASWAGKVRLGERWVLDGPVNNPLIHYIHEGLFFAGAQLDATARPVRTQAELYHAHEIEGEDTACMRLWLENDVDMMVYLTLCAPDSTPPVVYLRCESGTVEWRQGKVNINALGHEAAIEHPGQDISLANFANFARAVRGEEPQRNPLSASRNVILNNNGAYMSSGAIHEIADEHRKRYEAKDSVVTEIAGIKPLIEEAAHKQKLFSELGVPWARAGKVVELDFVEFDPGFLLG